MSYAAILGALGATHPALEARPSAAATAPAGAPPPDDDDPTGVTRAPSRYTGPDGLETIDVIRERLGDHDFAAWCRGNVLKYTDRAELRPTTAEVDRAKARFYTQMALHVLGCADDPDPRAYRVAEARGDGVDAGRAVRRTPGPPPGYDDGVSSYTEVPMNALKALKLIPILAKVLAEVAAKVTAAKADGHVTPDEVLAIVVAEIGPLAEAIAALVA